MSEPSYPAADDFPRFELVTITEAQRRAAFTVLTPDRLPTGWRQQPFCRYRDAAAISSAMVHMHYRTDTGSQRVSIVQMAAADAPRHYGMILGGDSWHEVLREGTLIKIQPTAEWLYAQAHLTRHGTFAYLNSEGLTTEELTTIAASVQPALNNDDA